MRLAPEIIARIRSIELYTKKILSGTLIGQARTRHKGSGFEFDQIRDYQQGDDIRFIDWKGSARTNKLLVRQYNEERSRTIMLMVDGSASSAFTSSDARKYDLSSQIAAVFTLVGQQSKDAVGLVTFSDKIEQIIPPARGHKQTIKIMDALFNFKPAGKTDMHVPFDYLARIKRRDTMAFVISDFITLSAADDYARAMHQVARRCDLIAVRTLDEKEQDLYFDGFVHMQDLETGEVFPIDLHKQNLKVFLRRRIDDQNSMFKKNGVDLLQIAADQSNHQDFIGEIVRFFARRMIR